jgi:crotonobetainyl-CoA:carnitine CoA-transferase CaiB-like acyl-CoA transferase
LEGSLSTLSYIGQIALLTGQTPERLGASHHRVVPYGRYRVKDGHMILTLHQPGAWEAFCTAAGCADLAADPRFVDSEKRLANRVVLEQLLEEHLMHRTRDEWEEILTPSGVPFGPVLDVNEALAQEQLVERGLVEKVDHQEAGTIDLVGHPLLYDGVRPVIARPAPRLGQHTEEILKDLLKVSAADRAALVRDGVVAVAVADLPS